VLSLCFVPSYALPQSLILAIYIKKGALQLYFIFKATQSLIDEPIQDAHHKRKKIEHWGPHN
jgi:hypothetical protein